MKNGGPIMRGKSRWVVSVLFLVVVVIGIARHRASSQSFAPSTATPFPIRQVAYMKASNSQMQAHFACGGHLPGHAGNALAISADGNTLAVGAPHETSSAKGINGDQHDTSLYNSGAVYVFIRRGESWVQQAYVKASNAGQSDNFGSNIALSADGNTMAVSAYWESGAAKGINGDQKDDSLPQAGAVYIFARTGGTWSQQAYIKASNTGRAPDPNDPNDWGDGDQFGHSIALSADGNVLAVGALSEDSNASGINNVAFQDDNSAPDAGAVYIFTRTGNTWSQQAYLKGSNTESGDRFGFSLALSYDGNTLAVAGYDEDGSGRSVNPIPDNLRNGTGSVYVLVREGGTWRQQAYLKGSQLNNNDALGVSVSISGDGNTIAAGAADDSCLVPGINAPCRGATWPPYLGAGSSGGAYVWFRSGNTWTEQAYLKATNPELEDVFGVRLSLSGDGNTLVVGAPNEDSNARGINGDQHNNSATEAGAAFIFTRSGNTWTQRAYVKGSNTEAYDQFGSSTAISRDGKAIVVGSPVEASAAKGVNADQGDNSSLGAGAVYVFSTN